MKFSYSQTFPKDAATVLKMFCDPAYHAELQKRLGSTNYKLLETTDDGTRFMIKMTYDVDAGDSMPGFAKKILGDKSNVVQTETWDRSTKKGTVDVQVKTLPGTMRSDSVITESGGTTTKTFNWEVNVKIPLVGGKIEQVVADDAKSKCAPEQAVGRELLAGY